MKYALVIGSINMDLCIHANRHPSPGETLHGHGFVRTPGGKGANQAIAAARFGVPVRMLGAVGHDDDGTILRETLACEHVDVAAIITDKTRPTGVALITVAGGENTIVIDSGANAAITPNVIRQHKSLMQHAGIVIVQHEIALPSVREVLLLCREHNVPCALNPAPALRLDKTIIDCATYITPNEHECAIVFNNTNQTGLLHTFPNKLIVTEGSHGAVYCDGDDIIRVPPHSVTAVDTTGAGDVFNGVFSACISEDMTIKQAIQIANIAAALSVKKHGAQTPPRREEVIRLYQKQ